MEPDTQHTHYRYSPLPSRSTVRLVRLYDAADPSQDLEFEFELLDRHSLLRPQDSFDAISYVWGEPAFTHRIVSRSLGQYVAITTRVDAILREVRTLGLSLVWIDSVCLNQADEDEKASQVPLMGNIYHQARTVRVWPGPDIIQLAPATDFLQAVALQKKHPARLEQIVGQFFAVHGAPAARSLIQRIPQSALVHPSLGHPRGFSRSRHCCPLWLHSHELGVVCWRNCRSGPPRQPVTTQRDRPRRAIRTSAAIQRLRRPILDLL